MGLSSKEVSGDHHRDQLEWTQTLLSGTDSLEFPKPRLTRRQLLQQQQPDPLKCPRCESANTKFCYYNNYNKSQPRHFCKACKRHWTNGGTLRNVPVGGGRKNKRLKRPGGTTTTTTISTATTTDIRSNAYLGTYNFPLRLSDDQTDKIFDIKSIGSEKTNGGIQELYTEVEGSTWDMSGGFTGSTVQLPQNPSLGFSAVLSSLSSFDTEPSSILSNSFSSLNGNYKYVQKPDNVEDSTIIATTIMPSSQQWQVPSTSNFMEMPSYWNWNDVDTLVLADLNKPWDDSEFKP